MRYRCLCSCHQPPDAPWRADGVEVDDVLEAAVACKSCVNAHCSALLPSKKKAAPAEKVDWIDPPFVPPPPRDEDDRRWFL